LKQAPAYLNKGGLLFFPVISFSDCDKILTTARPHFSQLIRLVHKEWPLPKQMYAHRALLNKLKNEGLIQFTEKFGMVLWHTDVYIAYNAQK